MKKRLILDFEKPLLEMEAKLEGIKNDPLANETSLKEEILTIGNQIAELRKQTYSDLTPWQKVQIARHPERPRFSEYLSEIFLDFLELHGDRLFGNDHAIFGGLAHLDGFKLVVVGHEKGKDMNDRIKRNFGMPHPEGYRKAARLFKLAEKFKLPLVTFIDTPGAYPGISAEERGQASAIAENLALLSDLKTPIIAIIIGEGGSGGALALGVSDETYMLENAYYSVITPEGCASILWKDDKKAPEAAEALKLTAQDLFEMKIIDGVLKEPLGGAHHDFDYTALQIRKQLIKSLEKLTKIPTDKLLEDRYKRIRKVGSFEESN